MTCFTYKNWTLVGLLDSDGTFVLVIQKRKDNKIGVSLRVEFVQQTDNEEVLTIVKQRFQSAVKITRSFNKKTQSYKSLFAVSLNTAPGHRLLEILNKKKPFVPSKRRDYLIALKCLEYSTTRTLTEVNTLQLRDKELEEKVAAIATCVCIYGMSNEAHNPGLSGQKKRTLLKQWLDYLNSSPELLDLGIEIGQKILGEIEKEVQSLKNYLCSMKVKLPEAYVVGYHLGDGCFGVDLNPNDVSLYWHATESLPSVDILKAIKTTLGGYGAIQQAGDNVVRLRIVGFSDCSNSIVPILDKYFLPKSRQLQFNGFKRCLLIFRKKRHLTYKGYQYLLDLSWDLNKKGSLRRSTKQQLLEQLNKKFKL